MPTPSAALPMIVFFAILWPIVCSLHALAAAVQSTTKPVAVPQRSTLRPVYSPASEVCIVVYELVLYKTVEPKCQHDACPRPGGFD